MPKYVSKGGSKAQQKQRTGPARSSSKQLHRQISKNANLKRDLAQRKKKKKLKLALVKKRNSLKAPEAAVTPTTEESSSVDHKINDAKEEPVGCNADAIK